jgi:hypothetical protein
VSATDGAVVLAVAEATAAVSLAVNGAVRATSCPSCRELAARQPEVLGGANNRNDSGLAVVRDLVRHQSGMS